MTTMEFDFLSDISFLVEELIVVGIIGGLAFLINHYRNKASENNKLKGKVKELRDEVWQINKAIVIMAKLIDEQVKRAHPEDRHTELEDITKEILTRALFEHNNK